MAAGGGGGDAVLAGSRLGDDALFAHAEGEQRLADGVVDLVGAGVEQVLALEPDLRAAAVFGEALGEHEIRRPAGELAEGVVEVALELRVGLRLAVGGVESVERADERLGDERSAVVAEVAAAWGRLRGVKEGHGKV